MAGTHSLEKGTICRIDGKPQNELPCPIIWPSSSSTEFYQNLQTVIRKYGSTSKGEMRVMESGSWNKSQPTAIDAWRIGTRCRPIDGIRNSLRYEGCLRSAEVWENDRLTGLQDRNLPFGFLLDLESLVKCEDINALRQTGKYLGNFYDTDIDGRELYTEIYDCKIMLDSRYDILPQSPLQFLSFSVTYGKDIFLNLRISLQIMLTIDASIASCGRPFMIHGTGQGW